MDIPNHSQLNNLLFKRLSHFKIIDWVMKAVLILLVVLFSSTLALTHEEKEIMCKQLDYSTCTCVLLGKSDQEILRCKNHKSKFCEEINRCWIRRQMHQRCKKIEFNSGPCRNFERSSLKIQMRILERRKRLLQRQIAKLKPFAENEEQILNDKKKVDQLLHILRLKYRKTQSQEVLSNQIVQNSEKSLEKLNQEYDRLKIELKNASPLHKASINFKLEKVNVDRKTIRRNLRVFEKELRALKHKDDKDKGIEYLHNWRVSLLDRLKRLNERQAKLDQKKEEFNSYYYNKWSRDIKEDKKIVEHDLGFLPKD